MSEFVKKWQVEEVIKLISDHERIDIYRDGRVITLYKSQVDVIRIALNEFLYEVFK